ncbi:MAG: ATP-dependent DNA ligase [Arachnia sp.]
MASKVNAEIDGHVVGLTNLEKPLFPSGFSKGETIWYYQEVASALLPQLRDRCLTRVRFPDGTAGPGFYEKNAPSGTPGWIELCRVRTSEGVVSYPVAGSRAALAWLANLAAIELHAPQWRTEAATIDGDAIVLSGDDEPRSSSLMVDLDAGAGIDMAGSARGAILAATALAEFGLEAQVKTSGGKGLQLSVAVDPTPASRIFAFARRFARTLEQRWPSVFIASMAPQARGGLLFVDYAQNQAARNTVVAYSLRAGDEPRVATPISWDEVAAAAAGASDLRFGPAEVLQRLETIGDLWAPEVEPARVALPDLG